MVVAWRRSRHGCPLVSPDDTAQKPHESKSYQPSNVMQSLANTAVTGGRRLLPTNGFNERLLSMDLQFQTRHSVLIRVRGA